MPKLHKLKMRTEKIHFADLGSGLLRGRAYRLAERMHKKGIGGKIHAVDRAKAGYAHPPNMELVQADAIKYLKSAKSGSIEIINADFLEQNIDAEHKLPEFFRQIKRVLTEDGQLRITTTKARLPRVEKMLREEGFGVTIEPVRMWQTSPAESLQTFGTYWGRFGYLPKRGIKVVKALRPVRLFATKPKK